MFSPNFKFIIITKQPGSDGPGCLIMAIINTIINVDSWHVISRIADQI